MKRPGASGALMPNFNWSRRAWAGARRGSVVTLAGHQVEHRRRQVGESMITNIAVTQTTPFDTLIQMAGGHVVVRRPRTARAFLQTRSFAR